MHSGALSSGYRPDIDGLRAIAVSLVLAFHAFPELVSGGFIGVDVFFVISGYLITGIVLREVETGSFSLKKFYARRIRRIFPALAVVLLATLGLGWFVMLDFEFQQLGKHTAAGAGFVSNLVLWGEKGYFNAASARKPLLHLWSLGIEEQFYIFWPMLVLLIFSRARERRGQAIALVVLGSFALNVLTTSEASSGAFYNPFTRFWELLCGAILAHVQARSPRTAGPYRAGSDSPGPARTRIDWMRESSLILGIGLILGAAAMLHEGAPFPGWRALAPTVGSALVIHSGAHSIFARWLLANPISVFVGLISYPLYLWHWPLLSISKITDPELATSGTRAATIAISVLLAWLTYEWVEKPIRGISQSSPGFDRSVRALSSALFVLFMGGLLVYSGALSPRLGGLAELSSARSDWAYPGDDEATIVASKTETILFFGDSYIQQYHPRFRHLFERNPEALKTIAFHTSAGCAAMPGVNRIKKPHCYADIERGFAEAASENVGTVIIGASWLGMVGRGDYFKDGDPERQPIDFYSPKSDWVYTGLQGRIEGLVAQGKRVYLVLNPPGGVEADPGTTPNRLTMAVALPVRTQSLEAHLERTGRINRRLIELAEAGGAEVIDPADWLCDNGECRFSSAEGIPYYKDRGHVRASFVRCCVTAFDDLVTRRDAMPEGN